jgi:hypothetical protein
MRIGDKLLRNPRALLGLVVLLGLGACTSHPAPPPTPAPPTATLTQPLALVAAPRDCPIGLGLLRGNHLPLEKTFGALQGHLPIWLPDGFGLAITVSDGTGSAWATWANQECREVTVRFNPEPQPATPGPRVGPWTVTADAPGQCSNYVLGTATCLEYVANSPDGSIWIQAMGIERSVGDRIVQSIPLWISP